MFFDQFTVSSRLPGFSCLDSATSTGINRINELKQSKPPIVDSKTNSEAHKLTILKVERKECTINAHTKPTQCQTAKERRTAIQREITNQ